MNNIRIILWGALTLLSTTISAQSFTEVALESGLNHVHANAAQQVREVLRIVSGASVGDYDNDGDMDLFLVGGGGAGRLASLFQNDGDGHFTERAQSAGLVFENIHQSAPMFADLDNDGWEDLIILSANQQAAQTGVAADALINRPRVFINQQDGTFIEKMDTGFESGVQSINVALADLDRDGDLDAFISHWTRPSGVNDEGGFQFIWLNDGTGRFTNITDMALGDQLPLECNATADGLAGCFSFSPNITDINNDGWLDVLLSADFGSSAIFISQGIIDGVLRFDLQKPAVLDDENGMGAAVADYDNDGDMDWFVSSIWDPNPDDGNEGNWGVSGNRLYRNTGNGVFENATLEAGIGAGYWGWGSCFSDFNNDGWLDLYHDNGFRSGDRAIEFEQDPAQFFVANGDGTFTEKATISGLNHTGQGRGVICFDYDLDGDQDILVMPNNARVLLYRNNRPNSDNRLQIQLQSNAQVEHIGARITVSNDIGEQLREVTLGSNFVSNNPTLQHFGLGDATNINTLKIDWPNDVVSIYSSVQLAHFFSAEVPSKTLAIGQHCLTNLRRVVLAEEGTVSRVLLTQNGTSALVNHPVTLNIVNGPNVGTQLNTLTNVDGVASFDLDFVAVGTDILRFDFELDGNVESCSSRLEWEEVALLADGFELMGF